MKFAIAGGGTGGHLFPALAVGEVLKQHGHEVLVFISEKEVDALAIKGRTDFRFEKLPSIGMPKLFSPAIFGFFRRFNASFGPCRRILAEFKPDAVLGMGGFTSTPPILAARLRGIRTFLHESNAIPGKANRFNARFCDLVLLGLKECRAHFPRSRCEVTGTPIRRSLINRISQTEALAAFGLSPGRVTVLVMGGSQGARGINDAMRQAAPGFDGAKIQIVHLTGERDEAEVRAAYQSHSIPSHVAPFCHEMEAAYSAADIVVARSGAASLAEISHFALPSILIPFPFAAEDHQQLNAEIFARAGAATLLKEAEITGDALVRAIRAMTADSSQLAQMGERARALLPEDAAARVAKILEDYKFPA